MSMYIKADLPTDIKQRTNYSPIFTKNIYFFTLRTSPSRIPYNSKSQQGGFFRQNARFSIRELPGNRGPVSLALVHMSRRKPHANLGSKAHLKQ